MSIIQIVAPFMLVILCFLAGHFLFPAENSGIYIPESSIDLPEEVTEELGEDVLVTDVDPETGQILPDKYNYLKIENVFSGQLVDADALFSIEVALLTKQPSISSDLFIAALYEIENEVVAAITPSILDLDKADLITAEGRRMLSERIRKAVNRWLENEKDMRPAITEVFIINLNVV
jgi:flagellar basal body-associated protein FliL